MVLYGFAERPGTLAVDNPHRRHMGKVGVVQIFIKEDNCFVRGLADQVDFCGDRG